MTIWRRCCRDAKRSFAIYTTRPDQNESKSKQTENALYIYIYICMYYMFVYIMGLLCAHCSSSVVHMSLCPTVSDCYKCTGIPSHLLFVFVLAFAICTHVYIIYLYIYIYIYILERRGVSWPLGTPPCNREIVSCRECVRTVEC